MKTHYVKVEEKTIEKLREYKNRNRLASCGAAVDEIVEKAISEEHDRTE